ncbi:MAG: Ldh family oxidoreductase [SAR324 cluster bacterium]|nr:Ldh family oxidoreductase [SAR324 cluster bacterium]
MPVIEKAELEGFVGDVFRSAGYASEEAGLISRLMVAANLCGHDSHGVRQIPTYLKRIGEKQIVPNAPITVLRESPTTVLLDANLALGHVAAARALEMGVAKAREVKVSVAAVRNLNHIGRVGAYPEMAAEQGMICLAFVQGHIRSVAPFGGLDKKLATNPFSAAFPNPGGAPILLDFASSVVAANKIHQAYDRGVKTGEGWIMDERGNPVRDPALFVEGKAAMLPLGGGRGHKGYALSVVTDIIAGVLSGAGAAHTEREIANNSTLLITLDPEAFLPRKEYERQVGELVDYLRATATRPGDPPVMIPGEFEENHRREREAHGIPIEEPVWNHIQEAVAELQVALPVPRSA